MIVDSESQGLTLLSIISSTVYLLLGSMTLISIGISPETSSFFPRVNKMNPGGNNPWHVCLHVQISRIVRHRLDLYMLER